MASLPARPTLADVAREAGVATVTVSRVLEGSDKVALQTRERVTAAMQRLGYFGNAAATQLVSGRTPTIGVVTSNITDYGYASTMRGIEGRARQRDMSMLISVIEDTSDTDIRQAVGTVASRAVAGVIVIDYDDAAHAVIPHMPPYLPVVTTTRPNAGHLDVVRPHVFIDEYNGAVAATEYLIELGHRSIFVIAPPKKEPVERRSDGITDALTAARLPHFPVVRCPTWRPESGYAAAQELLDSYGEVVTAIACGNDELALGAMRAIAERGLRVPDDISIVGFDDNPLAAYCNPGLTTVAQDFTALGFAAFDLLAEVISGNDVVDPPPLATELIVRESTAPPHPERGLAVPRPSGVSAG
ncbi:MAG: LacI family DNA-binding transcriptional regulator [Beutenbergiaceae bacterium]